ncbi:MAG: cupin domain-containing protein [Thermomicrobium sp.]|nr:cupin domain-containing protein [Thermomicrobium sp.]MCS7246564.1 cupin domain-containing protein [Thermomicrobium sp.]
MEILRSERNAKREGPREWFTGDVVLESIPVPSVDWKVSATIVHFAPGARTAWHVHPRGQTLYVLSGIGLVQRRGGPIETIRAGDCVQFAAGEEHWHGAAPEHPLVHLALTAMDDEGMTAVWGPQVSEEEYRGRS